MARVSIAMTDDPSIGAPLPSPHDMADAVVAEAMAERARLTQETNDETMLPSTGTTDLSGTGGGNKRSHHTTLEFGAGDDCDPEKKLRKVMESETNDDDKHEAITKLLFASIENMMQEGLKAFHSHESTSRDLTIAKEEMESKDREIQRLRSSEESSRNTITNLLRAIETSKGDARDASRHAQIEAKLRNDISALRGERDEALGGAMSLKRKVSLLDEDLRDCKNKFARVEQEKIKIERDSRAAISLAKSVGSETSSDVGFYKRKASELQNQLSAQQALVAEQKMQLVDMRRQQERSMSQNRLATMRAEGVSKGGRKSY